MIMVFIMALFTKLEAADYPEADIHESDLKAIVKELTRTSKPRNYHNPDILNQLSQSIFDQLKSFGYRPEFQDFTAHKERYRNVLARIGPEGTPKLIVGAHYDCHGDTPGADDNASAVAGLITLAKLLKPHESALKCQIEFAAYTLEEPPFFKTNMMGSYIHAEKVHQDKAEVLAMICLEMIGYFTEAKNSQQYPVPAMKLFYPSVGNFIAVVSNFGSSALGRRVQKHMEHADIDVQRLVSPAWLPGVDFSDHLNYWKFDYPAVMITDTAFYRSHHYHQMTDTIETLDFTKMKEVIRGVYYAILNLTVKKD